MSESKAGWSKPFLLLADGTSAGCIHRALYRNIPAVQKEWMLAELSRCGTHVEMREFRDWAGASITELTILY